MILQCIMIISHSVFIEHQMHDAYSDKSGEEEVPKKSEEDLISDDKEEDEMELETAKINSSRLVERLSQFDARTNKMADGWYLKFADVRRGSFLPRASGRQKQNSETAEWKERCKKRGRLPAKDRMTWQRLSPTSVIFLHWIGFDPMSALSPPNEEATQALGYLAYDFFGKIVEKVCLPCAIFFYNACICLNFSCLVSIGCVLAVRI